MDKITIIMAAGKGTRMKSEHSKLVQKIYDKEIVKRVEQTAIKSGCKDIIAIVGHKKEEVAKALGDDIKYAEQKELLGTGHAVMQAIPYLENKDGIVVVLNGDVPIIRPETINKMIEKNIKNKEYATLLTAIYDNPKGYGRIVRDSKGEVKGIVEEKDATPEERKIQEINAGIYCFDIKALIEALKEVKPNNAQGEYYLTDVVEIMNKKGLKVGSYVVEDDTEILGVNTREQLEMLTNFLRLRINKAHMANGVTIEDINTAYIYDDVEIGKDTVISPNVIIKNNVKIGENCIIGANSYINEGVEIKDNTIIEPFTKI